MKVTSVARGEAQVNITMSAVSANPCDAEGVSEDNSWARWTPCAALSMTIQNPNLLDAFKEGQTFFLDFTEHVD